MGGGSGRRFDAFGPCTGMQGGGSVGSVGWEGEWPRAIGGLIGWLRLHMCKNWHVGAGRRVCSTPHVARPRKGAVLDLGHAILESAIVAVVCPCHFSCSHRRLRLAWHAQVAWCTWWAGHTCICAQTPCCRLSAYAGVCAVASVCGVARALGGLSTQVSVLTRQGCEL